MSSRISHEESQGNAPVPGVVIIRGEHLPFASIRHPGWRAFYARIEQEHNLYNEVSEQITDLPQDARLYILGKAFQDLAETPEGELDDIAKNYLKSINGMIDTLVEGICLGDPSRERQEVREFVGGLLPEDVLKIRFIMQPEGE